jgi:hypothetical protein
LASAVGQQLLGDVAVGGLLQSGELAVADRPQVDEPHVRFLITLDAVVVAEDEDVVVAAGEVLLGLGSGAAPESYSLRTRPTFEDSDMVLPFRRFLLPE